MITVLLIISSLLNVYPQQEQTSRPPAQERIKGIIERLEKEKSKINCKKDSDCEMIDWFIEFISKEPARDQIRYPWMDKMQGLGIREATFDLEYIWKRDGVHFKFTNIAYFQEYVRYKSLVKDWKHLRRIKQTGLEKDLKDFVVAHLTKQYGTYQKGLMKRGETRLDLFDDEALPILEHIY